MTTFNSQEASWFVFSLVRNFSWSLETNAAAAAVNSDINTVYRSEEVSGQGADKIRVPVGFFFSSSV